jgi:hypothetical protein
MRSACRSAAISLAMLVLGIGGVVRAASPPPPATITNISVGFDNRYKVGYWTPVSITLRGGDQSIEGHLELIVPDGDGVPSRVSTPPSKPIVLLPGRDITIPLFAKIGRIDAEITARFVADGKKVAEQTIDSLSDAPPLALPAKRSLVLAVGRPLGIEFARSSDDTPEEKTAFVSLSTAEAFPVRWYGYESADAVVLCTSNPEMFRKLSPSSAQIVALDRWIRLGGRLVLCVGDKADEVLAADAPLAMFAPGKLAGRVALKQTNAWETYTETSDRLDASKLVDAAGEFRLEAPKLEEVRGTIEAFDGSRPTDLPLVVRTPHGLGEVVFVAADLDRPPFVGWQARQQMLDKLLGNPPRKTEEADHAPAMNTRFGFGDLTGQLRSALEQFTGVQLVPFSLVALLIILYIIAIGPVDYLLLKRVFKRMEWTWFTFPVIVLVFSGTAYALAYALKGNQLRGNQVDVLDFDADTQLVRGTTWTNLFSPRVDSYDVTYKPKLPGGAELRDPQVLISWMGLPGDGFGGMSAPAGAAGLFSSAYDFSPSLDAMSRMPIAVWSTKGITGRWSGEAEPLVTADLTDLGDKLLSGTITSKLDEPLTDCVLIYDRWAYPIGKLDARARFAVETKLDPQTVETYFKHISLFGEKDAVNAYDPANLDVGRIVETMMFHRLLGGNDYTKLSNEYQQFLDLSGLLRAGRAILIGRGPKAGAQLLRDGKPLAGADDQQWTFYRFVYPVKPKPSP